MNKLQIISDKNKKSLNIKSLLLKKVDTHQFTQANLAIVIGGDQMCIYNNEVFDKPGTREKAISNLLKLSGTSHFQYSGICLYKSGQSLWEYCEYAEMVMHKLEQSEIENYVDIENPINAAGAYKFESLGCNLFKSVIGSSYTVRGMPLLPLLNKLRELGIIDLNK